MQLTPAARHRPPVCGATFPGVSFLKVNYLWLRRAFAAARRLSLVGASGGHSSCIAWVSHYGDFSCCRQSTGSRRAGSVVMVHRLSCFTVYGMFLDQGLNPCPLYWQADCYPLYHQGSSHCLFLYTKFVGTQPYSFIYYL